MVKLRLKRFGRRNSPFYRLGAMDSRRPRNGQVLEELGAFNPNEKDPAKAVTLKTERINYWLSVGAQPSDTVRSLLKKAGLTVKPAPGKKHVKYPAKAPAAATPAP